jgi:hypothetical protein
MPNHSQIQTLNAHYAHKNVATLPTETQHRDKLKIQGWIYLPMVPRASHTPCISYATSAQLTHGCTRMIVEFECTWSSVGCAKFASIYATSGIVG